MGMLIYDALVMAKVAAELPKSKKALALGVPTLNFSANQFHEALKAYPGILAANEFLLRGFKDYKDFFRNLGFESVSALDISDYEGANIIGDLNDPACANRIADQYHLVYDHGTLEHVFDASAGLRTINRLVRLGGIVLHSAPANGFMDHGFWQISPNLLRSFYQSAGFEILTSALLTLGPRPCAFPAGENFYRTRGRAFVSVQFPENLVVFAARKTKDVHDVRLNLQDYYAQMHKGAPVEGGMQFFLPFGSPILNRLYRTHLMAVVLDAPLAALGCLVRIKRWLFGTR